MTGLRSLLVAMIMTSFGVNAQIVDDPNGPSFNIDISSSLAYCPDRSHCGYERTAEGVVSIALDDIGHGEYKMSREDVGRFVIERTVSILTNSQSCEITLITKWYPYDGFPVEESESVSCNDLRVAPSVTQDSEILIGGLRHHSTLTVKHPRN